MNTIDTIEKRLKYLRKDILNYGQIEFGKKINLNSNSIVSQLENGTRTITDRTIADICREFNVNEEWLREGTGEIFKDTKNYTLEEFAISKNATETEVDLFKAYLNLPEDLRKKFMEFVADFGEETAKKRASQNADADKIITLPYVARGGDVGIATGKQSAIDNLVDSKRTDDN